MDCVGWCTWENGSEPERKWCDNTDFDGWGPARLTQKVTQLITNHKKTEIWLISALVIVRFILILINRIAHHPDESPLMEISYRNVPVRQNVRQIFFPSLGKRFNKNVKNYTTVSMVVREGLTRRSQDVGLRRNQMRTGQNIEMEIFGNGHM